MKGKHLKVLITSHFTFFLENQYQEDKCWEVLEEMRKCCIKWKSVSLCCEGIDLDKTYNPLEKKDPVEDKTE